MKNLINQRMKNHVESIILDRLGKSNAITVKEITTMIGEDWNEDVTGRPVRLIVRDILKTSNLPIGSCNAGYFTIQTEEEYQEVQANLSARAEAIFERQGMIEDLWLKSKNI